MLEIFDFDIALTISCARPRCFATSLGLANLFAAVRHSVLSWVLFSPLQMLGSDVVFKSLFRLLDEFLVLICFLFLPLNADI